jgi:hypothetical protein
VTRPASDDVGNRRLDESSRSIFGVVKRRPGCGAQASGATDPLPSHRADLPYWGVAGSRARHSARLVRRAAALPLPEPPTRSRRGFRQWRRSVPRGSRCDARACTRREASRPLLGHECGAAGPDRPTGPSVLVPSEPPGSGFAVRHSQPAGWKASSVSVPSGKVRSLELTLSHRPVGGRATVHLLLSAKDGDRIADCVPDIVDWRQRQLSIPNLASSTLHQKRCRGTSRTGAQADVELLKRASQVRILPGTTEKDDK